MNRELNTWIAENVMGLGRYDDPNTRVVWIGEYLDYSGNIAGAWLVRDEMERRNYRMTLYAPGSYDSEGLGGGDIEGGKWICDFGIPQQHEDYDYAKSSSEAADTAPLAICLAAKSAIEKML